MSTNTIIALVVAVLIVLGGGYYVMSGGYSMEDTRKVAEGDVTGDGVDDTVAPDTDKASPKLAEGSAAFTGSFFDLATRGGHYKCDVTADGTATTKGTVYVSGADLRGDFNTMVNGKNVESHMLKLADQIYVWSSLMPQGVTMKATAMQGQTGASAQGTGVSGTERYAWNCAATGTDATMFVVPGRIKFMDVNAMMPGAAAGGSAGY